MIPFRGCFPVTSMSSAASYPTFLDVLHEEEESSVASPATVQLVENQQQLEQLNLHQNYGRGGGGGGGSMMRCAPPSIVITGVGFQGSGGNGTGGGNGGQVGVGGSGGGAIALH